MHNTDSSAIQDFTYGEYQRRLLSEVTDESIIKNSKQVIAAKHFIYKNGTWEAQPYEGAAVVSMLSQSEKNNDLISRLIEVQHQLIEKTEPTVLYFLPVESFHQTIANTLSAERFHKSIVEAGLEATYPDIVQQAFSEISLTNSERQISMKMIGLSLFGTALAMVGIFEDEHDYQAITHFRKSFYANDQLNNLGVKMTRPFIGHVTLAYIESELNEKQTSVLSESIIEINSKWQHKPSYFHISYTELRRYHHLAEFLRPVNYPRYNFHIS